jgi:amidase/aspartyl-tRNA(Asn)/glutamyl-tRNA(Gln) amidotransferase subunit A
VPQADIMHALAIHFHLGFAADVAIAVRAHPELVTAYATDFPRWAAASSAGGSMLDQLTIEGRLYPQIGDLLEGTTR